MKKYKMQVKMAGYSTENSCQIMKANKWKHSPEFIYDTSWFLIKRRALVVPLNVV
jgi:hypothetical protein